MKVLFTHSYFLFEDEKEQHIMRPYVPLGILYLSAYLEEKGIENDVFDSTFSNRGEQLKFIEKEKPEIVAIYTNLMTKINVIRLIQDLRSSAQLKTSKIVLGGPDVTYNIEDYLKAGADFLVIGEGEETMHELSEYLLSKKDEDCVIPGIAFLKGDEVVKNEAREKIRNIDELPFPNRSKINIQAYLDTWKEHHNSSSMTISTQRGCPYTCKWCSTAVYGMSYRRRSPKLVVDELEFLVETYQPDSFWFVDDVFTVSHKWLNAFKDEIISRNLKISFECISRADRMNEEVIKMLKSAGCQRIWIGAESGSQKIIDAMDRRVDVEKVQEMIQVAKQYNIETGTFIMLGYPEETEEDILQTVHHLKASDPDHFTITVAYPIKGTGLYDQIEARQTKELDWNTTTDRDRDFTRTYSRRYYDYAVKYVVNEVNFHKKLKSNQHMTIPGMKLLVKSKVAKTAMLLQRISSPKSSAHN